MFPLGTSEPPVSGFGCVTIRPQAATTIDIAPRANPARRIAISLSGARALAVSALCAVALHLAFPRTGYWWTIPFALAGLVSVWSTLTPRAAFANGYLAGIVYFSLAFAWFGETAGALIAPFGFIISIGPAILEALAFGATASLTALAFARLGPVRAVLATAAAFTAIEWLRSIGTLGLPFGGLGLALVDSPLRPLAAYVGGFGMTFITVVLGATFATRRWVASAVALVAVVAVTGLAYLGWPARTLATPTLRVAAVQGNIAQKIKATDAARVLAYDRYSEMTAALADQRIAYVLWPETVILTDLTHDDRAAARFAQLARSVHTTLAVGTWVSDGSQAANAIVTFGPTGGQTNITRKRQLVPFGETLPGPQWLRALPFANEIGNFAAGSGPEVEPTLHVGTLICWESLFGDLARSQVQAGAQFFAVPTDDAWFGTTDGPYQHAQATTLRAVETGRWVVRAASTGISGIIAPDGVWRARSEIETQTTVIGEIGGPVGAPYQAIGPTAIGLACVLLALGLLVPWRRARS